MATQLVAPSPCDTLTISGILPWLGFGGRSSHQIHDNSVLHRDAALLHRAELTELLLINKSAKRQWIFIRRKHLYKTHLGTTRISLQISTLSFTFSFFWSGIYIISIIYLHNASNLNIHKFNFKDIPSPWKKKQQISTPIRIHKFSASVGTGIFNFAFLKTAALPSTHEGNATVPLMVAFPNTKNKGKTWGRRWGEKVP